MAVCRAVLGTNTAREKKANESANAVMTSAPTSGGIVIPISRCSPILEAQDLQARRRSIGAVTQEMRGPIRTPSLGSHSRTAEPMLARVMQFLTLEGAQ